MASKNNPISSKDLILMHSKARVIVPSRKAFVISYQRNEDGSLKTTLEGKPIPILSRQLTDADALAMVARKFA